MNLASLFPAVTWAEVKAKVAGFAELGGLLITAWQSGDPGEQLYQAFTQALAFYSATNAQAIRAQDLDTATDPGDDDPYEPTNITMTPEPGALSALGLSMYATERPGETFATTSIKFVNSSGFPAGPFSPGQLTVASIVDPRITYRNAPMPSVYVQAGSTYTLPASVTPVYLDFIAETPGTVFNANPGELTELVTQYSGVTVTNESPAIGTDRMSAPDYRALCRTQASTTAPNGTRDAYLRWSRLNRDGSPLLRPDGAAVGITKVQVSGSSTTGAVQVYYADGDGVANGTDVTTANANIALNIIGVGDCITFTGASATAVPVVVTWAVEFNAMFLGRPVTALTVDAAIRAALAARFVLYPIGGFKQTLGAGSISLEEIRATVKSAHPAISDAVLSSPVGATALAVGQVAKLTTPDGTETPV
jgi:hypothetical protein